MNKLTLLFTMMILCSVAFTQDNNQKQTSELSSQQIEKKNILMPPYFSILTMVGGVSVVSGGSPKHTSATLRLILEGYIPVKHKDLYLYTQFRSSFFIAQSQFPISFIQPIIHLESSKVGFLLGLGYIVKDWRNKDYQGWHIALNGGFVFEYGFNQHTTSIDSSPTNRASIDQFYNIGFEINVRFHYSISKHKLLTLGFDTGYLFSPFSGDPFYLGFQRNIVSFNMLYYGITAGLSF